jgi:plastocyanin
MCPSRGSLWVRDAHRRDSHTDESSTETEKIVRIYSRGLAAVVLSMATWGCGTAGSPAGPSSPATVPGTAVTINVVAVNGSQSFSPNPATLPAGQMIVWHNVDTTIHRMVLDDLSIDTGVLQPGAFSSPMALTRTGGYHCTIHPEMVGTIKGQ